MATPRRSSSSKTGNTTPKQWKWDRIETRRRVAKLLPCPKCGKEILKGPDDDIAACAVLVDPEPIGEPKALNEARAIAKGLGTFTYVSTTGELWARLQFHRSYDWPVLVQHEHDPLIDRRSKNG